MKALVVGGDAAIGSALSEALQERGHSVVRTSRRGERAGVDGWVTLDLASPLPPLPDCDVAFLCAAITGFAACRSSPQLSERVNVGGSLELANRLAAAGSRVILLSTSAVFDCAEPCMRIDRPYAPRGIYGAQKAAAERGVLMLGSGAMVVRLSKVLSAGDARINEWRRALSEGRPLRLFHDHLISPISNDQASDVLLALAEKGQGGIYQASGADDISYADLGFALARRLGAPAHLVRPCSAASAGVPVDEITPYNSLDSSRITELCGFIPPRALTMAEQAFADR